MIRTLLADDEKWILQGLQASVDWEKEGFFIVDTAKNGIEAREKILSLDIDFVITDIRMPGFDGLSLMEDLKAQNKAVSFAIISGYAEFSYAKKGIDLGAIGYLTKPVDENELLALLKNVKHFFDNKRITEDNMRMFKAITQDEPIRSFLKKEGYAYLQIGGNIHSFKNALYRTQLYDDHFFLLSPVPIITKETKIEDDVLSIGVCKVHDVSLPFSSVVDKAKQRAYRFFSEDTLKFFDTDSTHYLRPLLPLFVNAIKEENKVKIKEILNDISNNISSSDAYDYLALWHAAQLLSLHQTQIMDITVFQKQYKNAKNVLSILEQQMLHEKKQAQSPTDQSIADYISKHFSEDISMFDLTSKFLMSASAIYRKLLQETGMSFQQYLCECRMQKARQLLITSKTLVNDIATMVGFLDPLYFRKAFKKTHDVTPSEYRLLHAPSQAE